MGEWNFNRKQCLRALGKLGFTMSSKRSGKHDKMYSNIPNSNPPFIMIPRHNNLHCQEDIVKELLKMGGQEMVQKFKELL